MSIKLEWHDAGQTILLAKFSQDWTLDDYHRMIDAGAEKINRQDHVVHVIYLFRQSGRVPHNLLVAGRYAEKKMPDNQGLVIFVNANVIIRAFVTMGQRMQMKPARNLYLADSLDDAISVIQQKSSDLQPG